MTVLMRRPILVGGVGLSMALWMLQSLQHSFVQMGEFSVVGLIALSSIFWWFGTKRNAELDLSPVTAPVDRETAQNAIAQVNVAISQLAAEDREVSTWQEKVAQLLPELDRQNLNLAVMGGKGVGKTSVQKQLASNWNLTEIPALFTLEGGETADMAAVELAKQSDLVLFVTSGDLTESEYQTLQQLAAVNQRVVLVFNKQDQYLLEEQPVILQQLRQRTSGMLASEDAIAIAAFPDKIKVRKHQADGSFQEWMEQPEVAIAPLTERLTQILATEAQPLVWATTKRKADSLKAEVKGELDRVRRDRALPIIEQYQWIAAATAFANPVPALDLLATGAITGQLVMDLGVIYQQKLSLQQAQTAAGTVGSLMLKLGLVELSTQTISGILKSNAFTYVAGGAAQGVSAAYLTRIAGLSLIEYFQAQELSAEQGFNLDRLGETLKQVFQLNQRTAFLQNFVKQAVAKLTPASPPVQLPESNPVASL